ncbi:porin [Saccharicrinis sp. FJH62]|uniref:porin n=1 Tax=Saccharicrinis sp. FJH62 TaxID=3344657 RepID=UPI0035D479DA
MTLRQIYTILILLISLSIPAQTINEPSPIEWDGYTQLRFTSNLNSENNFAMRRMKLWIGSAPEFSNHWGFHLQTTITSLQNEKFLLQDVMAFYEQGQFRVNMGQFVPHYSLQRFQHDYEIPLTERTGVINALIPNGTLGVRDIGIEAQYTTRKKHVTVWLGAFNGYGIKEYRLDNTGFLFTQKTAFDIFSNHLYAGYSVMIRQADQLKISNVLPDSVSYSGNDFRFNLFAQWHTERFNIQAEYLQANLDGNMANGWYVLVNTNFGKNQLVASWNQYNDLISETENYPEVHLGYNYKLNGDKLKVMLDNRMKVANGKLNNYSVNLQLQLFFR